MGEEEKGEKFQWKKNGESGRVGEKTPTKKPKRFLVSYVCAWSAMSVQEIGKKIELGASLGDGRIFGWNQAKGC